MITVGSAPDSIKALPDCSKLVVAVEAEPYETELGNLIDPPGEIAIITFSNGISAYSVNALNFTKFDNQYESFLIICG